MGFFLFLKNKQSGPFTFPQIQYMWEKGTISKKALYREGQAGELKSVSELFPPKPKEKGVLLRPKIVGYTLLAILIISSVVAGVGSAPYFKEQAERNKRKELIAGLGEAAKQYAVDQRRKLEDRGLEFENSAINREVIPGMLPEHVITAWGYPDAKRSVISPDGTFRLESWLYSKDNGVKVVVFKVLKDSQPRVFDIDE